MNNKCNANVTRCVCLLPNMLLYVSAGYWTHTKYCTCHKPCVWTTYIKIGQTSNWPSSVWSSYRRVILVTLEIITTTSLSSCSAFITTLLVERLRRQPRFVSSAFCELAHATIGLPALMPPSSHCACGVDHPSCPGARTEQSLLGWGEDWGVGWHHATISWLPVLTRGKEGGCCVSDWWEQVCGLGIECCRTDVLLAHPALSAARPPALRTRLIGTPNCPYEYFRREQEWEFRVGGMVSRALTANDPLNNQREREGDRE